MGAGRLDVLQTGVEALESLYETADGWLCLIARDDAEITMLQFILRVEILGDARFATPAARRENRDDLAELLRARFASRSKAEWLAAFNGSGVPLMEPAGPGVAHELMNDPLQRGVGRVAEVLHPEKGKVREVARLIRISDARVPGHRLAPGLGEHSEEILRWLGYSGEQIAELARNGEVRLLARPAASPAALVPGE